MSAVLQESKFYPAGFPAKFACGTQTVKPTVNSTNSNATKDYSINCVNPVASVRASTAKGMWWANVALALLVCGEIFYLSLQALLRKRFTLDCKFCQKQFWIKKTRSLTLRHAMNCMREQTLRETETLEPLIAESDGKFKLDDNFVDSVIYTGRAEHEFTNLSVRHEISDDYSKPQRGSVAINTVNELFLPNEDSQNPCKILVVGRPGIGKSLLCTKISRDWGQG